MPKVKIGDIAKIESGFAFSSKVFGEAGIPVVRMSDLKDGDLDLEEAARVPKSYLKSHKKFALNSGDFLIGMSGSINNFATVNEDHLPALLNQRVGKLKVLENYKTHYSYLTHFFTSGIYRRKIAVEATGAAQLNISASQIESIELELPNFEEQKRIAGILDEVDSNIAETLAESEKLRLLEHAILHKWFLEVEHSSKRFEALGSVGTWLSGGTPSKAAASYWNGNIPWISAKDLKVREIYQAEDYLTEKGARAGTTIVDPGAILFVVRGMILAHTFPVAIARVKCAFNQDLKAIVPNSEFIPEFLHYWLIKNHDSVLKLVTEASHGTKKIETEVLSRLRVPIVERSKQQQIISMIAELNNRKDSVKREIDKMRLTKEGLLSKLIGGMDA